MKIVEIIQKWIWRMKTMYLTPVLYFMTFFALVPTFIATVLNLVANWCQNWIRDSWIPPNDVPMKFLYLSARNFPKILCVSKPLKHKNTWFRVCCIREGNKNSRGRNATVVENRMHSYKKRKKLKKPIFSRWGLVLIGVAQKDNFELLTCNVSEGGWEKVLRPFWWRICVKITFGWHSFLYSI